MNSFIFDIGKTNLKCQLLDSTGASLWSVSRANTSIQPELSSPTPYIHFDVENIWQWLLQSLREAVAAHSVDAINISTHGACAVLLTENGELALPVLDYEDTIVETVNADYDAARPAFNQTLSPNLPAGLNVGRQLWWLRQNFPEQFTQTATLLFYPQYWAWRLSGVRANERTSLGCHTDLWQPASDDYSSLVEVLNLRHALPPLVDNRDPLGTVTAEVTAATGIDQNCKVFPGVHDSNASLACHLWNVLIDPQLNRDFTVVSSGTWIITMAMGMATDQLSEQQDTLANVNVLGEPVACARFMGGREFEAICERSQAQLSDSVRTEDLQQLIEDNIFALPNFAGNSGPFGHRKPEIVVPSCYRNTYNGKALATLYIALMIDLELELLGVQGSIVFGSTSLKNPLICQLLAQLRPTQQILLSQQDAGTVKGCWALANWNQDRSMISGNNSESAYTRATPSSIQQLEGYKQVWRQQTAQT